MGLGLRKETCPNCNKPLGDTVGKSQLYGSQDVGDLCEPCYLEEEELIEREGTNAPQRSNAIADRLDHYRL